MGQLMGRLDGRLRAEADPLAGGDLPLDEHASAALRIATERAEALQRDGVSPSHLLIGILEVTDGPGSTLLRAASVTATTFGVDYAEIA
jgi:predicted metal-dependent phosphotriesterase family hydrolase